MYLNGKTLDLNCEVHINKTETNKSVTVAAKAEKETDVAKREGKEQRGVVTQLQRRLVRPEGPGSAGNDRLPLGSGSLDDRWRTRSGPGRLRAPG